MASQVVWNRGRMVSSKICVVCKRSFTWRKKWEKNWDEVQTCSKRCNTERKRINRRNKSPENQINLNLCDTRMLKPEVSERAAAQKLQSTTFMAQQTLKEVKRAQRAKQKAERRALRVGYADKHATQKRCKLCSKPKDLLIRCRFDSSMQWHFICGPCWRTPAVANGITDGDGSNPFYTYGGLWKNNNPQGGIAPSSASK
mmetsp:Transcript_7454/g.8997  ORF Transcript_7454/g.8997 Transcript_7454/m.8997 type:complete len:200 (-) Transcript_7454:121-720(-)